MIIREYGLNEYEEYRIVGSAEAIRSASKISHQSPVGAALMGKRKGERVTVETPAGRSHFKIIDVR